MSCLRHDVRSGWLCHVCVGRGLQLVMHYVHDCVVGWYSVSVRGVGCRSGFGYAKGGHGFYSVCWKLVVRPLVELVSGCMTAGLENTVGHTSNQMALPSSDCRWGTGETHPAWVHKSVGEDHLKVMHHRVLRGC